jgi:hypothetical protein
VAVYQIQPTRMGDDLPLAVMDRLTIEHSLVGSTDVPISAKPSKNCAPAFEVEFPLCWLEMMWLMVVTDSWTLKFS